jgi:WD40 repeat protein
MSIDLLTKFQAGKFSLIPGSDKTCFVIRQAFNPEYCHTLLSKAIELGFNEANLKYPKTYRNNERVQIDDALLAKKIFAKCRQHIPKKLEVNGHEMELVNLNSRLRFCKYSSGQNFSIHQDGTYYQNDTGRSALTFLLYLNDSSDYVGGTTSFFNNQYGDIELANYKPQIGDILVFDHKIWHSGDIVEKNSKYILRSDFIYEENNQYHDCPIHNHQGYIWKLKGLPNKLIASSSRDKTIKIWNEKLELLQTLKEHENSVFDMSVNTSGDIYAVSRDGFMSIFKNLKNKYSFVSKIDTKHSCVLSVLVLGCGRVITTGSDNKLRLWNEHGLKLACSSECNDWQWKCVKLTKNRILSCSGDGCLNVWSIEDLSLIQQYQLEKGPIRCLELRDGYIYLGFENGCVSKLNSDDFTLVCEWQAHKGIIRDLLVDEDKLISCGEDNQIQISLMNGQHIGSNNSHNAFVTSLVNVGDNVYSASYDGFIKPHYDMINEACNIR